MVTRLKNPFIMHRLPQHQHRQPQRRRHAPLNLIPRRRYDLVRVQPLVLRVIPLKHRSMRATFPAPPAHPGIPPSSPEFDQKACPASTPAPKPSATAPPAVASALAAGTEIAPDPAGVCRRLRASCAQKHRHPSASLSCRRHHHRISPATRQSGMLSSSKASQDLCAAFGRKKFVPSSPSQRSCRRNRHDFGR